MSSDATPAPGTVGWMDLTVPDAESVRDFYAEVTGWKPDRVSMGDYQDFCMVVSTGQAVTGICHARGEASGRFCVIQDPAGAVAGLYESRAPIA